MRPGKRIILFGVAASLSASALLASGILVFGDLGETERRILATTALIAAYGLLALPAGMLFDQARFRALATAVLTLAVAGLSLALVAVWVSSAPEELGKTVATVTVFAVAFTQTAALSIRRSDGDPPLVRRLFAGSVALALTLAAMTTAAAWGDIGREGYYRIMGALAVLDVLLVALQPILALTRPRRRVYRLSVLVEPQGPAEIEVEAEDFAKAASLAIRTLEQGGGRARRVELLEQTSTPRVRRNDQADAASVPSMPVSGPGEARRRPRRRSGTRRE